MIDVAFFILNLIVEGILFMILVVTLINIFLVGTIVDNGIEVNF